MTGPGLAGIRRMIATRRQRLVLLAPVEVATSLGGASVSYTPLTELWAEIAPLSGGEGEVNGHVAPKVKARITIRWRTGMSAAMRFSGDGRVFEISALFDPDGRRRHLVCMVEEVAP